MPDLDDASEASRQGRYEEAIERYRQALGSRNLCPNERVHVMCHLASNYRLVGEWDTAKMTAREAVAIAHRLENKRGEAHALLTLGTIFLCLFHEDNDANSGHSSHIFGEAMDSLDGAAGLYQELGLIDFYTCLLTIGQALQGLGESSAEGIYARITRELCDERWSEPAAIARHADHLRARAFMGLAQLALDAGDSPKATDRMEAAVGLLLASGSGDPVAVALLEHIANSYRADLDDSGRADEIVVAAKSLR